METIWFVIVAVMLAGYVLLDGFDLGAGAIHLFAARTDKERREVLATIGHTLLPMPATHGPESA